MATILPHRHPHPIPRPVLRAAGVLVVGAVALVGLARLTDMPPAAMPPASMVETERAIVIARTGGAGVIVTDAASGEVIVDLGMAKAGFIAGVDRALSRERMKNGLGPDLPVRLVRWQDGRLSLIDPSTGWRAELKGFGPTNLEAFARLLD